MDCRTLGMLLELPGDLEASGWGLVMCRTRVVAAPSHPHACQVLYSRWAPGAPAERPAGAPLPGTRLDALAQSDRSWADAKHRAIARMRHLDACHAN